MGEEMCSAGAPNTAREETEHPGIAGPHVCGLRALPMLRNLAEPIWDCGSGRARSSQLTAEERRSCAGEWTLPRREELYGFVQQKRQRAAALQDAGALV